jgi:phage repressor protein C with HTH and peptisase S24 domain
MLSHEAIWKAIDAIAARNRLTPSGLARKSGLDPTSFNKSKRITRAGRPRWPSTESVAKALRATDTGLDEFIALLGHEPATPGQKTASKRHRYPSATGKNVPVIGMAQAGVGGFFDDGGYPVGQGWDEIPFPAATHESVFALQVSGDSMAPLYRDRDLILVSVTVRPRKGDRIVVKTRFGEVMAKILKQRGNDTVELASFDPDHPDRILNVQDVDWIARILWASQ